MERFKEFEAKATLIMGIILGFCVFCTDLANKMKGEGDV